jgi:hypothetical protein
METFKLATKLTAKYLITKVQGKPLKRREVAWSPPETPSTLPVASPSAPPHAPVDESPLDLPGPEELAEVNPFASSMPFDLSSEPDSSASPFPEATDYEKVEEVSLEELLEGRERPATMSGLVAVPDLDEPEPIEVIDTDSVVEPEEIADADEVDEIEELTPLAVEEVDEVSDFSADEVAELRRQVQELRAEQDRIQETLAKVLSELTGLIRT